MKKETRELFNRIKKIEIKLPGKINKKYFSNVRGKVLVTKRFDFLRKK